MAPRTQSTPSVWTVMSYTPPRGRCNHKTSLMSPVCPCLRFMLHPVKAATSFECDGCGHHASFHSMENKDEEEIVKKWKTVEEEGKKNEAENAGTRQAIASVAAGRKRRRVANEPANADDSATESGEARGGAELREIIDLGDEDQIHLPGVFSPIKHAGTTTRSRVAPMDARPKKTK